MPGPGTVTYDHRRYKIRDPVRSPLVKLATAGSVLRSVTTGESPVLYVFDAFRSIFPHCKVELAYPLCGKPSTACACAVRVQAGPILRPRPSCAPPAVHIPSLRRPYHGNASPSFSNVVGDSWMDGQTTTSNTCCNLVQRSANSPIRIPLTNIKLTSPPANPQLPRNINIPLSIPLPAPLQPRHHVLIPFPHTPTIRARHLPTPTRLPPLGSRPRLKAHPVHILPARRPAPHHRLPAGTLVVHLAETNRTVALHGLPPPLGISANARGSRRQRRASEHLAHLARQQRQLVHQVVARAQHPRQHVHGVLALGVAGAGVRAVAAGLAGDGGGVDVAGRAGEDDGFFLFGVCFSCCFGGRGGGGGVAGAGEDVEALGGGAGVEVVEGLWGVGAESVWFVGLVGICCRAEGRGRIRCLPSESFLG